MPGRRHLDHPDMAAIETSGAATQQYKRVGGWLALFCFCIVVLGPITGLRFLGFLVALVVYNRSVRPLWSEVGIDAAAGIALIVLGLVAGIQLLRVKSSAVKLTMMYFAFYIGYMVFTIIVVPPVFGQSWRLGQIRDGGLGLLFVAIWVAYFKLSTRVAAMYGPTPPEPSNPTLQPTSDADGMDRKD